MHRSIQESPRRVAVKDTPSCVQSCRHRPRHALPTGTCPLVVSELHCGDHVPCSVAAPRVHTGPRSLPSPCRSPATLQVGPSQCRRPCSRPGT